MDVIVAESYARIFFRNSVATGELYPYEARERLIDGVKTGDLATVDFDNDTIEINGKLHQMKPMGDVRPVIEAGGLFNYATPIRDDSQELTGVLGASRHFDPASSSRSELLALRGTELFSTSIDDPSFIFCMKISIITACSQSQRIYWGGDRKCPGAKLSEL